MRDILLALVANLVLLYLSSCGYPSLPRLGDCRSSEDCAVSAETPICHNGSCVECTQDDAVQCGNNEPICSLENSCRACSSHEECETICTTMGACAEASQVAYVDSQGTDNSECTKLSPCLRVSSDWSQIGHMFYYEASRKKISSSMNALSLSLALLARSFAD